MESEVLAERILLDLENAFKKDPLIDEFDILPVSDSVLNKCPVILAVHKLGLESWCVRHVYLYVYTRFVKWRQHPYKIDSSVLLSWTTALLLINPDVETAWNCRKELVQRNKCSAKDDLKFSEVVLSRKPKSPQLFAHRRWILTRLLNGNPSLCTINQVIEHELRLCMITAKKYSNNYYVWNHRMWILQHLLHFCSSAVSDELRVTEQWVSTHVSDHSGFHYRQFLIKCRFTAADHPAISNKAESCPLHSGTSPRDKETHCFTDVCDTNGELHQLLAKELHLLSELQSMYPGHETLWNHRRFIVHEVLRLADRAKSPGNCTPSVEPSPSAGNKKYKLEPGTHSTIESVLASEDKFLHGRATRAKGNFWEHKLTMRHENWLKNAALRLPHT